MYEPEVFLRITENVKHQIRHLTSQKVGYFNLHSFEKRERESKASAKWAPLKCKSVIKLLSFNFVAGKISILFLTFRWQPHLKYLVWYRVSVMHVYDNHA